MKHKLPTIYKLPERFKLSKLKDSRIQIYDSLKQVWGSADSLKEVFERIEIYLEALRKIETTKVPNGYQIVVIRMERSENSENVMFFLIDNEGKVVMASPSFEQLLLEATNTPESTPVTYITEEVRISRIPLIVQLKALNNGETLELWEN